MVRALPSLGIAAHLRLHSHRRRVGHLRRLSITGRIRHGARSLRYSQWVCGICVLGSISRGAPLSSMLAGAPAPLWSGCPGDQPCYLRGSVFLCSSESSLHGQSAHTSPTGGSYASTGRVRLVVAAFVSAPRVPDVALLLFEAGLSARFGPSLGRWRAGLALNRHPSGPRRRYINRAAAGGI